MSPLVSVLIPCHNAVSYVGAAIESVISQTWQATQIIVVNDGSTDGSDKVLQKYPTERIRVVTPANPLKSAAKSRNLAYEHSTGDFIKFFDADDVMHPKMIEHQIAILSERESDVASSGWGRFYRDDLTTFKQTAQSVWRDMDAREWLVEALMDAQPMMQPGMFLIPRKIIDKVGGWDEQLSLIDDFEFFARVLAHADNVRFTPDVPLMYRSGLAGSLSGRKSDAAIESAFHSLSRGTEHLLNARDDHASRLACANVMQDFIYSYYPRRMDLCKQAAVRVAELGGSTINPQGPPKFQKLRKFIGWRLARRIQQRLGR